MKRSALDRKILDTEDYIRVANARLQGFLDERNDDIINDLLTAYFNHDFKTLVKHRLGRTFLNRVTGGSEEINFVWEENHFEVWITPTQLGIMEPFRFRSFTRLGLQQISEHVDTIATSIGTTTLFWCKKDDGFFYDKDDKYFSIEEIMSASLKLYDSFPYVQFTGRKP